LTSIFLIWLRTNAHNLGFISFTDCIGLHSLIKLG
jgi:hypothetical protein